MRYKKFLLPILILIIILAGALELQNYERTTNKISKPTSSLFFIHPIRVGDTFFSAAIAVTDAERTLGLSGSQKLETNQALLFVFPNNDKWGIWMKDMNYPIDIISYIKENVDPSTYPEVFYPPILEHYVLELPAGTVENTKIQFGDPMLY
jgi:uncharacterized membrane protein (UPF0127 family)